MYLRCPHCQSVYPLQVSQLAAQGGQVRCDRCNTSFNALEYLFDHHPAEKTNPLPYQKDEETPTVGENTIAWTNAQTNAQTNASTNDEPVNRVPDPQTRDPRRTAWLSVFWVLLVITLVNLAWTFREPLMKNPTVQSLLEGMNIIDLPVAEPFSDLEMLHLVSRDMHPHPSRSGLLIMSFTFVNRAHTAQPFPDIELIIRNTENNPLAIRKFKVSEYLPDHAAQSKLLAPNLHIPVFLEFADPGPHATGFELNFKKATTNDAHAGG